MDKGINTYIEETKKDFANLINSKLQEGLPISVINIIVEGICRDIQNSVRYAIEKETNQKEESYQHKNNDEISVEKEK